MTARVVVALACLLLWPATALAAETVIVAAGDIACDPDDPPPPADECHHAATSDLVQDLDPAHVLVPGDIQYDNAALSKFLAAYDPTWGRFKAITKPVPGNHEYGASGAAGDYDPNATGYFDYFDSQLAPFGAAATDPKRGWYSFDVPGWHVVAINSECAAGLRVKVGWEGGCAPGSPQERWLRADLAANRSSCTLAFWHHAAFSSGPEATEQPDERAIMTPIWDALHDDWADVALTGHDHLYERFGPQDISGRPAPGRGIRQWVVGTGGKNLKPFEPNIVANSQARDDQNYGVLKLTLRTPEAGHPNGWYQWAFVRESGAVGDSGSADCVAPPRPAAPAPAARTAPLRPTARPARARIRGSSRGGLVRVSRSGRLTLKRHRVDCLSSGPRCDISTAVSGRVSAAATLGRLKYRVRAGRRGKVRGKLGRRGRRALRRQKRVKARLRIRVRRGQAVSRRTIRVTLRAARR